MSKEKRGRRSAEEQEERESIKRLKKILKDYRNNWTGIMLFTALGLIIIAYVLIGFIAAPNYSSYLPVSALITRAESKAVYRDSRSYGNTPSYQIYLTLLYKVGEKNFETSLALTATNDYSRTIYKEQKEITIYYNPQKPEEIGLRQTNFNFGHLALLIMGAAFLIIGLAGALNARRQIKRIEGILAKKRGAL